MRRLFFYTLFLISFAVVSSNQLMANEPFYTMVEAEEPFDYKLIHGDKNREGYMVFSVYDAKINQTILFSEILTSAKAIYGEDFYQKINFVNSFKSPESNGMMTWHFQWHKDDDMVENVQVYAFRYNLDEDSCCCVMLIDKGKRATFDLENSYNSLHRDFLGIFSDIALTANRTNNWISK